MQVDYIPDNYDAYVIYENEQERIDRLHRKIEIEMERKEDERCNN